MNLKYKTAIILSKSMLDWNSSEFTLHHKKAVYDAFLYFLKKEESDFIRYLDGTGKPGYGAKVFQLYTEILNLSLPISYVKNKKKITINNITDSELGLFDGISEFTAHSKDGVITNNTQEFFVSKNGTIGDKFYIGKLLDLTDAEGSSIMENVTHYGFGYIAANIPDQKVYVKHLRIPPSYQRGGMAYVSDCKKKISNENC